MLLPSGGSVRRGRVDVDERPVSWCAPWTKVDRLADAPCHSVPLSALRSQSAFRRLSSDRCGHTQQRSSPAPLLPRYDGGAHRPTRRDVPTKPTRNIDASPPRSVHREILKTNAPKQSLNRTNTSICFRSPSRTRNARLSGSTRRPAGGATVLRPRRIVCLRWEERAAHHVRNHTGARRHTSYNW